MYLSIFVMSVMAACVSPDYRDASLSPAQRTEVLLKQMTVEEKVGQLLCPLGWPMYEKDEHGEVGVSARFHEFIDVQHGGMLWATFRADPWTRKTLESGLNPRLAARTYNELQRYAIKHSRLGIPIILAEECPHGHMAIGTTVFPTGIGMAATWDTQIAEQVGRAVAQELRAQGGAIGYGPIIDLAREPRWSRVEETYGEDVCLTSQMAAATVRGMSVKYNGPREGIVSTLKHFVAYGIPAGGHNGNPSSVGERDLWENFLPPFRAAFDAGALSVMASYNAIDGVPNTANTHLLRNLLREEWGFDGIVVSDLESIDGLVDSHHIARDKSDAGEMALTAGIDVDLGANCFPALVKAVRLGRINEEQLDEAAGRVLRLKFELGLFDNPYVDECRADSLIRTLDHVALARQAARESVVLLKNNGILPLSRQATVAVIGPNADNMYNQLGDYTAPQARNGIKTMLDGIRAVAGDTRVRYVRGCAIRDMSQSDIAAAVRAARATDVSVVVVGGSSARDFATSYLETGAALVEQTKVSDMECGEGFDRATLTLLGRQQELLETVRAVGKPMVVVYIEGRPLDKRWPSEYADALLTLWYPGQEGGAALADVLYGDYNPAGRLPISVPREVGQLPVWYNQPFPEEHDYVEVSRRPLYEFGYGLSYTRFEYDNLQVTVGDRKVDVSFDVRNAGDRDGEEVVQLYITDCEATVVRPRKQLRGFRRVPIRAGACERLHFTLGADDFALYDQKMRRILEPGEFCISVGASSEDIRLERTVVLE